MSADAPAHVQRVLDRFDSVRATPTGWSARCPAHKDRKNSLSIGIGDNGQVLVNCFTGCDPGMVLYHKDLTFKDLYQPTTQTAERNGQSRQRPQPPPQPDPPPDPPVDEPPKPPAHVVGTTRDELRDQSGSVVAVHVRRDYDDGTKSVHWEQPDGRSGLAGIRVDTLPLFGIHQLGTASTVVVCEGEKAAKALRDMGVTAVGTVTGASSCPCDDSLRPLLGLNLILWPDNDDAGRAHMDRVGASLRRLGQPEAHLFLFAWADAPAKGDAADFVARGGTRAELRTLLGGSAQPWQPQPATQTPSTGPNAPAGVSASVAVGPDPKPSQATKLTAMVRDSDAELFHDTSGDTYLTVSVGDHRETHLLRSRAAKEWLRHKFYELEATALSGNALRDAIEQLSAEATFSGACRPVHVRRAGDDDNIYLDLGDAAWQVVHVTAQGWQVVPAADMPVRFRRPGGMLALPQPILGGNMELLRPFVNVTNADDFKLVVAWLLGVLRPRGPYPILALSGEQGSAKSTLARTLRSLLDPNVAPLRTLPRDEGDLLIAAKHGLAICYDNVSSVSEAMSDALCRLATGGGLGKRTLYTDIDETLMDATRPVILTGIESALTRGDAMDRALMVELQRILKSRRRTESEIDVDLEAMRPGVLGALLTAASASLANWPTTRPETLPRMADFGRWVEAGAPALGWQPGAFLAHYDTNRNEADEIVADSEPIGPPLIAFIDTHGSWTGTANELLVALGDLAGEKATKAKEWPKSARGMAGRLKRIAPNLRRLGYAVETGRREGHAGHRLISLSVHEGGNDRPHRQHRQQGQIDADAELTDAEKRPSAGTSQSSARTGADGSLHDADSWLTVAAQQSSGPNGHHHADVDGIRRVADDADGGLPRSAGAVLFETAECRECGASVADGQTYCRACDPRGM
jgi:hypothetical protein